MLENEKRKHPLSRVPVDSGSRLELVPKPKMPRQQHRVLQPYNEKMMKLILLFALLAAVAAFAPAARKVTSQVIRAVHLLTSSDVLLPMHTSYCIPPKDIKK
jgi:hypothetical protein